MKSIIERCPLLLALVCFLASLGSAWMNHWAPHGEHGGSMIEVFWVFSVAGFFVMTVIFVVIWFMFENEKYNE